MAVSPPVRDSLAEPRGRCLRDAGPERLSRALSRRVGRTERDP
jgi:hypothetical protein